MNTLSVIDPRWAHIADDIRTVPEFGRRKFVPAYVVVPDVPVAAPRKPLFTHKRKGALHFIRLGRLNVQFSVSKKA